jgi:hypothetical protein
VSIDEIQYTLLGSNETRVDTRSMIGEHHTGRCHDGRHSLGVLVLQIHSVLFASSTIGQTFDTMHYTETVHMHTKGSRKLSIVHEHMRPSVEIETILCAFSVPTIEREYTGCVWPFGEIG